MFLRHDPAGEPIPLVLDSPHSGDVRIRDDFDHAPPRAIVRRAEDTHVATLWRAAPAFGATLLEARFPRAYIDPTAASPTSTPNCSPTAGREPLAPSRKTQQGIGLVWRLARDGVPMYARKLTSAEVRCAHRPLLAAVSRGARRRARCASRPLRRRVALQLPFDARGRRRAGRRSRARARRFRAGRPRRHDLRSGVHATRRRYAAATWATPSRINDPYKGVEIVRRHGRPAENRHSLQMEIKRTLYMDEQHVRAQRGIPSPRSRPGAPHGNAREPPAGAGHRSIRLTLGV